MLNNVSPRARSSATSSADNPELLVDRGGSSALVSATVAGVARPGAADGVAASSWMGSAAGAATACSAEGAAGSADGLAASGWTAGAVGVATASSAASVAGSGAGIGAEPVGGTFSMLRVVAFCIAWPVECALLGATAQTSFASIMAAATGPVAELLSRKTPLLAAVS